ncbi:unnamed protein product [Brassica oleracea var. botrytis]|uniref:(rape) hypothetical protein n=1 Tax=Brassica napus TaxID=3708 RepID=A0A816NDP3_BRANA|nr:hypothetical protein HID58_078656 [Brassica napus]CAF2032037.1 unnamed protein product [Brassica napus]
MYQTKSPQTQRATTLTVEAQTAGTYHRQPRFAGAQRLKSLQRNHIHSTPLCLHAREFHRSTEISSDYVSPQTLDRRAENHCYPPFVRPRRCRRTSSSTEISSATAHEPIPNYKNHTALITPRSNHHNPKDIGFQNGSVELCKPPLSMTRSRRKRSLMSLPFPEAKAATVDLRKPPPPA